MWPNFTKKKELLLPKNLTVIIEPVILIAIALGIGVMVISIIYPIYQFTGQMGK